ncbi:MAG: ABC transporter ATP-binding protein [Butyricicoccus sp.]
MIEAKNIRKKFPGTVALERISLNIPSGSIYGLMGSNGAGKSTLMRIFSGVLRPDRGTITLDGEEIFEHISVKQRCFSISDDPYFFSGSTPREMMRFYQTVYPQFDTERCRALLQQFGLKENRRLRTFSKGMQRQVSIICAVSSGAEYLFCDEAFDGLDPVARQAIKTILIGDVADRKMTVVISSHNLQELENFCDCIGLLHRGTILFSCQMDDIKQEMQKVQYVADADSARPEALFRGMQIVRQDQRGRLCTVVVRGSGEEMIARMQQAHTVFYEPLPLSLEEIFIIETEENGYDPNEVGV